MKNYCELCFKCNGTRNCIICEILDECVKFQECFGRIPSAMWGSNVNFDEIIDCIEKWRLYNGQTTKQ